VVEFLFTTLFDSLFVGVCDVDDNEDVVCDSAFADSSVICTLVTGGVICVPEAISVLLLVAADDCVTDCDV